MTQGRGKNKLVVIEVILYSLMALTILSCWLFDIPSQEVAWAMIIGIIFIQSLDIWLALNKKLTHNKNQSIATKSVMEQTQIQLHSDEKN